MIVLFNERLERLDLSTNLNSLDIGKDSKTKIIVRYPLSRLNIKQLKIKESVFDDANAKEAIARELISAILVNVGIAQNLVQLDSVFEMLKKRKIGQPDIEYESIKKIPMIGIITNGKWWIFIRHTCEDGSRKLEVSKKN
ncbi:hypothetical protein GLOIN_2v1768558 [Rhizophagus clarus]|uniref:Uncharacterized protein n=1 Tax=Rhizophagus clarus TaxID=94130 RepID=A0A8H3M8I4_9GLOM|nr:hypothetical protein GLOIN_2v1768558 [Rhizophagus clarus]